MSAELSELLRSVAREEAAAAEHEFPLSPDSVKGYVRSAGRRRAWLVTSVAIGGVVAAGGVAFGVAQLWQGAETPIVASISPSATASGSASTSPSPTPSASTSPASSPTASASPTPTPPESSPPESSPPAPPVVDTPAQVTVVSASTGGGSGEVLVHWDAVDDAVGYTVYRATTSDGEYSRAASIAAATGVTTVEFGGGYEYIQIWQPTSTSFEYVEAVDGARAYFRVVAFNEAGRGPKSTVVCGAPPGASEGC